MNNSIIDLFLRSKGGIFSIILGLALLFIINLLSPDYSMVECRSKDQYCVATANFLGFKQSKTTFKATDIVKTKVDSVRHSRRYTNSGSSYYGSHTTYNLYVIDRYGNRDMVLHDVKGKARADELGADLLYCISAQKYPCRIRKPFSWF